MSSPIDYTSINTQFAFDVNNSPFFKKDNQNLINILGKQQLNTLKNLSLLDIYLSATNVVEPHYHPNAEELVYCISGAAAVALLNPFTRKFQNYSITPGEVVNIPQGWWHYEFATEDSTHLLAIFDAPTPEVILGSDILKLTPASIMAHTYCLDKREWKKAIAPLDPPTYIGPPTSCIKTEESNALYSCNINQYDSHVSPTQEYNPDNSPYPNH